MKRRIATITMMLFLALTSLSSCGKDSISQDDLGKINDIKIESSAEEESSVFEEQPCPFQGYSTKEIKFYSALMSLKIPSSWAATSVNPSQIKISVPSTDPNFPGNTFYIQALYDYPIEDDGLSPDKGNINRLYKPFTCYIEGLKYSVGGSKEGSLRRWRGAWDEIRPPSFVGEAQLATTGFLGNEMLYDRKTSSVIDSGVGLVATFFKWQTFPVMISTFTKEDRMDDAALMTEYIMSTAKFKSQKIKGGEEKQFGKNERAVLPSEFERSELSDCVYFAPCGDTLATSGISIGIYEASENYADKENAAEDIVDTVGEKLAYDLMDPSCPSLYKVGLSTAGESEKTLVGEQRAIFANCSFTTNERPDIAATKPYGSAAMQYLDIFIVSKDNGKTYLVATLFSAQQSDLAYAIERQAINTFKVKN